MQIRSYYMLMKPGIVFGNAVTAAGGFALGSGSQIDLWLLAAALFGLCLIVASGCVLNNYLDRVSDQKMARTRGRALARGVISEKRALFFGLSLLVLGTLSLVLLTNWLATLIALLGFVVYVGFYTIWKYRTIYGTQIGSIAGAVPPVVGYCAVSGQFDLAASLLFAIVALWQMPHFFAIALYRMQEYASASIPVLPLKRGVYATKLQMFFYLLAFFITSILPTVLGYTGFWYLMVVLLLGLGWIWICLRGLYRNNLKNRFLAASALPQNSRAHSRLASGQWPLAPHANFEEPSCQIPDSSDCFGINTENDRRWAREMFLSSLVVILGLCAMIFFDRVNNSDLGSEKQGHILPQ